MSSSTQVIWTEYLRYRARLRGFDLGELEHIVRHTQERYFDIVTGRYIAVGRISKTLVIIPYEIAEEAIIPVTIHATTRQQINFRLRTGRLVIL